jgi:hypothetical protein
MSISVRRVDLENESHHLLAILQQNLPALPHARRFEWLYRANPDGPPWSWFACEAGRIVGITSVFPRFMWIGGQLKMCGQVGDFAIAATHRSLGPALLLQRATLQPVDEGVIAFCYDCPPHEAGMAPFRRLGFQPNVTMRRYALPLRTESLMSQRLGFAPPLLTSLGNFLLRSYNRNSACLSGLKVSEHAGDFGEEFTSLDDSLKDSRQIRGRHSAAHLNWRYRQDPLQQYKVLTARRKGELVAFLVFSVSGGNVTILDICGRELRAAAITLLKSLVDRYGAVCQSLEGFLSDQNDLIGSFLGARFRSRSVAAHVVAYAKPDTLTSAFLNKTARWTFNGADLRA